MPLREWMKNQAKIRVRDEGMDIEGIAAAMNEPGQIVVMEDERTEYTAPVITLSTVKEAIAVWSPEDRQALYEYLNRVHQVRMR